MVYSSGLISRMNASEMQNNFRIYLDVKGEFESVHGPVTIRYHFSNKYIGWGRVDIRRGFDDMSWNRFYPMAKAPCLKGNGLGTLAHASTVYELSKELNLHPQFQVEHNYYSLSDAREAHLKAMGLEWNEPLETYWDKSLNYARKKGFRFGDLF